MRLLSDLFFARAQETPDKTAIWCDGETVAYGELAARVSRYANFLLEAGVAHGEHIGIPMNVSVDSVALIFAAATIGVCLAPINPTLPSHAVEAALRAAGVRHFMARERFLRQMGPARGAIPGLLFCLDSTAEGAIPLAEAAACSGERPEAPWVTGEEILLLSMTSGTTGAPKPIELTQNIKHRRATLHNEIYGVTREDTVLAATPLYHSLAERLAIMPLIAGGTSALMPRFTPSLWLRCVTEQRVTFTIAVSTQLTQIVQLLSSPFAPKIDSLRRVVSSSALLEPHVRNALTEKLGCEFHEMYGTSETSTVTDICFQQAPDKRRSVGTPLPGAKIRILREDGTPAPTGEIGEIVCKSPLICRGYWGQPEEMERHMADGFFMTGDMGRLDEDGYLYFSGRKKEVIITGGVNAYPQDIEECVAMLEEVEISAAFAYPDDRLGEVVALAVVLKPGRTLDKRAIQIHCARNLADFQQPHRIFFVDKLPRNDFGKLVKTKLLEYVRLYDGGDGGKED